MVSTRAQVSPKLGRARCPHYGPPECRGVWTTAWALRCGILSTTVRFLTSKRVKSAIRSVLRRHGNREEAAKGTSTRLHHPVSPACPFLHHLALRKHPSRQRARTRVVAWGKTFPTGRTPVCAGRSGAPLTGVPPCREQGWSPTPPALHRSEATTSPVSRPRIMERTHEIDCISTRLVAPELEFQLLMEKRSRLGVGDLKMPRVTLALKFLRRSGPQLRKPLQGQQPLCQFASVGGPVVFIRQLLQGWKNRGGLAPGLAGPRWFSTGLTAPQNSGPEYDM